MNSRIRHIPVDGDASDTPPLRWLALRLSAHWPLKLIVGTLLTAGFFAIYFMLQHAPVRPLTIMPVTPIDDAIAFQPWAVLLYVSLWIYIPITPSLEEDRRELLRYCGVMAGICGVGILCFVVWPTAVIRPAAEPSYPWVYRVLTSIDGTANACPSLHAASAVFAGLLNHRLVRTWAAGQILILVNWCWCVGILYATLATRQHVFIDLVAGAALGLAAYVVYRSLPREQLETKT